MSRETISQIESEEIPGDDGERPECRDQQLAFRQDLAVASEKLLSAFEAAGLPPHAYDAALAFHLLDLFYRMVADGDEIEFLTRLTRCANALVQTNIEMRQAATLH